MLPLAMRIRLLSTEAKCPVTEWIASNKWGWENQHNAFLLHTSLLPALSPSMRTRSSGQLEQVGPACLVGKGPAWAVLPSLWLLPWVLSSPSPLIIQSKPWQEIATWARFCLSINGTSTRWSYGTKNWDEKPEYPMLPGSTQDDPDPWWRWFKEPGM